MSTNNIYKIKNRNWLVLDVRVSFALIEAWTFLDIKDNLLDLKIFNLSSHFH